MADEQVQAIQERFEQMFAEGITPWTQHGMEPVIPEFADRLLQRTPIDQAQRKPRVLDIGCGNGWVSLYFATRGLHVQGIDSSRTAIAEAKEKAAEASLAGSVKFTVGNGLSLPYDNANFEGVFDRGFFHHVPEDEYPQYLAEVTRVLTADGLLSLHAFTKRNPASFRHRFAVEDIQRIFGEQFTVLEHSEDPFPNNAPAHLGHYLLQLK